MADKRRGKKRREEFPDPDEKEKVEKPSKDEYEVAKWLRNNVPIKKTKFLNHNVQYFTGSKAVDALMASKWGTPVKEGEEPFFASREHCVDFLDLMLRHKFFHRARKVPVSEDMLRMKKSKKEKEKKSDEKEKKEEELAESSHAEGKAPEGEEDRKKKKMKVRLEMHMDQCFADNFNAYVWIYDPIPAHYWFFGALVVLAAIGVCMFPLWPPGVRMVVYYLSVLAAGFLVFIIALAVLRFIIFCLIWILTLGKHHLWLFPNLTEDVSFFASFWPLYHYEYKDGSSTTNKKKKKKDKQSDNEEEDSKESAKPEHDETKDVGEHADAVQEVEEEQEMEGGGVEKEDRGSGSESESSSQQSQTGKDFEIVERSEVEQQQQQQ